VGLQGLLPANHYEAQAVAGFGRAGAGPVFTAAGAGPVFTAAAAGPGFVRGAGGVPACYVARGECIIVILLQ